MKVCFVVQRYGLEVNGGAEAYTREVAEHLCALPGYEVACLTTCAVDYQSWKNEYEPGVTMLNGVKVERLPNVAERDVKGFGCCGGPSAPVKREGRGLDGAPGTELSRSAEASSRAARRVRYFCVRVLPLLHDLFRSARGSRQGDLHPDRA